MLYSAAYSQPKLNIIDGDTYNWGKVKLKDAPLKSKIKIRNDGTDTLNIENVKPSCGCTTAPLDKNKLKPGEIATMDVTVQITAHSGQLTKSITITSNDPKTPSKVLFLKADVTLDLEVSPTPYFPFDKMKVGSESSASVKVKNKTDKEVTLSDFKLTPDNLSINLKNKKVLLPGEEIEVVARVTPNKKGYFNCEVTIKTSCPDLPELKIQGYGNVDESPLFNN